MSFLDALGIIAGLCPANRHCSTESFGSITHEPKVIMLSEIASDIHFISLETTDDFFLCDEYRIIYTGDDISGIRRADEKLFSFR